MTSFSTARFLLLTFPADLVQRAGGFAFLALKRYVEAVQAFEHIPEPVYLKTSVLDYLDDPTAVRPKPGDAVTYRRAFGSTSSTAIWRSWKC